MADPKMTYAEARDRLGDNAMFPANAPLSDWTLEALYNDGMTPETIGGTPEDKAQYASYYKGRKMLDSLYPKG